MNTNLNRYYFTQEHELFRDSLRKFLEKEVLPYIEEWEAQQQVPKSLWRKFGEQGFLGFHYPPEYGGAGLDFFYTVVFTEEISRVFSGGFGVIPLVTQYMSTPYIYKYGSEYLKQKYLPPVIRGEKIAAIGISELGAGSDVANIQTRAIRQGDEYLVTGQKTFISNGYYGDFIVLVVKTQPEAGLQGISLLVVDLDSPGITRNKLRKLGWHASDTAELFFDQVRVPAQNLVGEEGKGFFYLMEGLQLERLVGAIGAIAGIEHLMEYTLGYMAERQAFGRPLNRFQVLRHRMAQLHAETQAIKAFVYHAARDGTAVTEVVELLRQRTSGTPLGVRIGLDLGDHQLVIDGTGPANEIVLGQADAPCVLQVAPADLKALLTGQLNPMDAFLSGRVQVKGDLSLAFQLQKLFT